MNIPVDIRQFYKEKYLGQKPADNQWFAYQVNFPMEEFKLNELIN